MQYTSVSRYKVTIVIDNVQLRVVTTDLNKKNCHISSRFHVHSDDVD